MSKRGGKRPGAGRRPRFNVEEELVIGGMVDGHIKLRTRRVIDRLNDEADATAHGRVYKRLVADLNTVDAKYVAPPGAGREAQFALTKQFRGKIDRNALRRQLLRIEMAAERANKEYVPPRLPAKTPDGIRDLAIRAMVRLLRRLDHNVPYDTVEDYLERYRKVKVRIDAGTADYVPDV
jgi:hypothetical protein